MTSAGLVIFRELIIRDFAGPIVAWGTGSWLGTKRKILVNVRQPTGLLIARELLSLQKRGSAGAYKESEREDD